MSKERNLDAGQEIFERAQADLVSGNIDVAERAFNYLLDRNKKNPDLWFFAGTCAMSKGYKTIAEKMFKECINRDARSVSAYNNLGNIYKEELKEKEAEKCFRKALEFFPKNASPELQKEISGIWNNLATLYVNNGTPDKAIEYCNNGLKYDTDNYKLLWNRSLAHLENSEWTQGWLDYEAGLKGEGKRKKRDYGVPEWDGTPGKTVVVYGEQGIGDEILFSSIIPDMAKDVNVILDCHPRLAGIFRNTWPHISVYGTRKEENPAWTKFEKIDYKISIGSIGRFYRNKNSDFPSHNGYLRSDKTLNDVYKNKLIKLGRKPKIGISWKGGYMATRKDLRSIPLVEWKDVFSLDADFISLQYTSEAEAEAKQAEEHFGIKIHHWKDAIDDYDETAGLVSELDLVISVCTSVIHLAGALNTPCYVLTPSRPAWRYGLKENTMIWYPSVHLYRQTGEDWVNVFKNVSEDACSLFQKNIAV